jgi:hypothetical protein
VTACTTCSTPLTPVPAPPGSLGVVWGHAVPPADGHEPGVPPVTVIYRPVADSWDAECSECPGFPVRAVTSLEEAQTVARTLLLRLTPPRPVIERNAA